MKIEQTKWNAAAGWTPAPTGRLAESAQLVLVFGATAILRTPALVAPITQFYPKAHILGCSTAGEICGTEVLDETLVVTAVQFEKSKIRHAQIGLAAAGDGFAAGEVLAQQLPPAVAGATFGSLEKLTHVFVLSDGLKVNGSELVRGLKNHLPEHVTLTGGLAGDGDRFAETLVFRDGVPQKDTVAVLGFYGSQLRIGYGSLGGWDAFGPERLITESKGNVLFKLDGQSALGLYKRYLGEHAAGLPGTGLLFPLSLRTQSGQTAVARTILSVDEQTQSMTFAGDVPQGSYARLMKANFEHLIEGASGAALASRQALGIDHSELAILISCVGRKLVLKQRIEEEVESVREVLGPDTILTGFYSYGEIAPFIRGDQCELHNQTMTITTFSEL